MKMKNMNMAFGLVMSLVYSLVIAALTLVMTIQSATMWMTIAGLAMVALSLVLTFRMTGVGFPGMALNIQLPMVAFQVIGSIAGVAIVSMFSVPIAFGSAIFQFVTGGVGILACFAAFCVKDTSADIVAD